MVNSLVHYGLAGPLLLVAAISPVAADCSGGVPFGQTIRALDRDTLVWDTAEDVAYVKGPLELVHEYATWVRFLSVDASSLDISQDHPSVGSGAYYLIKSPGPPCGSWQTTQGAESRRDVDILPECRDMIPSDSEIDAAVAGALVGLSNPWSDASQFLLFQNRLQDLLGCALGIPTAGAPGHCGVGNAGDGFGLTLPVGSRVNDLCRDQDVCYRDNCIGADPSCDFSPRSAAAGCDEQILTDCDADAVQDGFSAPWWHVSGRVVCRLIEVVAAAPNPAWCSEPACVDELCLKASGSCGPAFDGFVYRGLDSWGLAHSVFTNAQSAQAEFVANLTHFGNQDFETWPTGPVGPSNPIDFPGSASTGELVDLSVANGGSRIHDFDTFEGMAISGTRYLASSSGGSGLPGEFLEISFDTPQPAVGLYASGFEAGPTGACQATQIAVGLESASGVRYVDLIEPGGLSACLGVAFLGLIDEADPIQRIALSHTGDEALGIDDIHVGAPIIAPEVDACPCFSHERLDVELGRYQLAWTALNGQGPLPVDCDPSGPSAGIAPCQDVPPEQMGPCLVNVQEENYRTNPSASVTAPSTCELVPIDNPQPGTPIVTRDDLTPAQYAACEANVLTMGQQLGCFEAGGRVPKPGFGDTYAGEW